MESVVHSPRPEVPGHDPGPGAHITGAFICPQVNSSWDNDQYFLILGMQSVIILQITVTSPPPSESDGVALHALVDIDAPDVYVVLVWL